MNVEAKLQAQGLVLPAPVKVPLEVKVPFSWVRAYADRVYVSGHGPLAADGSVVGPFGRVGADVSAEQACEAARSATLAVLASLKRELGELDRICAWLTISGMVNVAPGFARTTDVVNACSELILELYGPEVGRHARTAIGMAQLPLNLPVVISAEVAVRQ